MNKTVTIIVSIIMAVCCITAIAVYATGSTGVTAEQEIPRTPIAGEKVSFSYYNTGSSRGAVAFSMNNKFKSYGTTEDTIKLCTKNEQGTYVTLYSIEKGYVDTRFYGKNEHSVSTDSSKAGGLSSIGITFEYNRTNVCFLLNNQPVEKGNTYYIYVPEGYFLDEAGCPNAGAYIEIPANKTNNYTGKLAEDLELLLDKIYDAVVFSVESVNGMLF